MQLPTTLLLILAVSAGLIARMVKVEKDIPIVALDNCRNVTHPLMRSSEDISVDHTAGVAVISSACHRERSFEKQFDCESNVFLGFFLNDTTTSEAFPFNVVGAPEGFGMDLHGFSLLMSDGWGPMPKPTNKTLLFSVNHRPTRDQIDCFELDAGRKELRYLWTAHHELFLSVNDVVALSPTRFMVTNDHEGRGPLQQAKFDLYPVPRGKSVVACEYLGDGLTDCDVVYDQAVMANGIQRGVYPEILVAETLGRTVTVLEPRKKLENPASEVFPNRAGMVAKRSIAYDVLTDNIEMDPKTNDMYIGAHGGMLTFLSHAILGNPSPSVIVRTAYPEESAESTVVFSDLGELFPASSVAAPFYVDGKPYIAIGGVFNTFAMVCPI